MEALNSKLSEAIAAWTGQLGREHVITGSDELGRYALSCAPVSATPAAVLRPANVAQVQAVIAIASEHKIPLYPISRGKNWGYGDACPSGEGNVVLDLGRLNRILEVNTAMGYAVVEPGVSQQDLYDHLQNNNIPLTMDVTGAPPQASLLGNVLERGYGQTPYSDHFLHSCGMEVVLADGRILRTGFGHYPEAKTTYLYKWGLGPYLDGIFTQSNFGVVTKLGIWLMPKPEEFGIFRFQLSGDGAMGEAMERLRALKMKEVLTSAVHLFNDIRVLSSLQQFPFNETDGKATLPEQTKNGLLKRWSIGAWNCGGGLRGSPAQVRTALSEVKKGLRGLAEVQFFSSRKLRFLSAARGAIKKMSGVDISPQLAFAALMEGVPTEQPTLLAYWRKKNPAPAKHLDPPRDRCGLIWCAPVMPLRSEDAQGAARITRTVCGQFGFETNISFALITARAISGVIGILYDRENGMETKRAQNCYEMLMAQFRSAGYLPYRIGSQPSPSALAQKDTFSEVNEQIKKALDPKGILAPGRYNINP